MPKSADRGDARQLSRLRPRFTTRAALLAVVICAVALSLAYPVREYISERRQISVLQVQRQQLAAQLRRLTIQQRELATSAYVEQLAENRLHMCMPSKTCYVIIDAQSRRGSPAADRAGASWYERLWSSVQQADSLTGR